MLRVMIDLYSPGEDNPGMNLAVVEIVNDGTGGLEVGNYSVSLRQDGPLETALAYAEVKGWIRKGHVVGLVARAMDALTESLGERGK